MIIAIDGPAASGKGTLARQLAAQYGYHYLDTGSIYRAVAFGILQAGKDPEDLATALDIAKNLDMSTIRDPDLRTDAVGNAASIVAKQPEVREAVLDYQRRFAKRSPGAVLDGRDIGTIVCPDADIKLFVTAEDEERARRRFEELKGRGHATTLEKVVADLIARDERDKTREISPLKPAEDAHLLDTTELSIEAAFGAACAIVERVLEADA